MIKYRIFKRWIKVFSDAKVLSSDFRKYFLSRLTEKFDLYEELNGRIKLLNNKLIEESAVFSESEIAEYKNFYKLEKIRDMSFEEFLDCKKIIFANIYSFPKNAIIDKKDIKKNKNLLAIIDLQPDGDIDSLWIEFFDESDSIVKLIDKYNEQIQEAQGDVGVCYK